MAKKRTPKNATLVLCLLKGKLNWTFEIYVRQPARCCSYFKFGQSWKQFQWLIMLVTTQLRKEEKQALQVDLRYADERVGASENKSKPKPRPVSFPSSYLLWLLSF